MTPVLLWASDCCFKTNLWTYPLKRKSTSWELTLNHISISSKKKKCWQIFAGTTVIIIWIKPLQMLTCAAQKLKTKDEGKEENHNLFQWTDSVSLSCFIVAILILVCQLQLAFKVGSSSTATFSQVVTPQQLLVQYIMSVHPLTLNFHHSNRTTLLATWHHVIVTVYDNLQTIYVHPPAAFDMICDSTVLFDLWFLAREDGTESPTHITDTCTNKLAYN